MTASYAETHIRPGLRNELWRHAVLRGWVGPLSMLWAIGAAAFIAYWQMPTLLAAWSVVAIAIGATMTVNELRSHEVARALLAAGVEQDMEIGDLGSVQDVGQLKANIAAFAEITVRIHGAGPGRRKDNFLDRAIDNMHALLSLQNKAANDAEDTWELELSPELCGEYEAAWKQLNERSLDGADPGPRFAMEFARATNEALAKMRNGVDKPVARQEQRPAPETEPMAIVRETHLALRNLANPARLAQSPLIARLPRTLEAASKERGDQTSPSAMTPLDQARLLGGVITAAIEKLSSRGDREHGGHEPLQHVALHERYVLGRPINAIITRHSIAETTFHRYRKDAISALAADLADQEENLSRHAKAD